MPSIWVRSAGMAFTGLTILAPGQLPVLGQGAAAPAAAPAAQAPAQAPLKAEELEQMLAPVALYPDQLLAQVLMASTYPLEIVQAARWVKSNPGKTGKALEDALQTQSWDASVKSLAAVPQVLQMLDEKLDWAQRLGDAFLGQRDDVMNAVQRLRSKAQSAGKLQSTKEQKVSTQQAAGKTVVVIEPANPQVVQVPVYNPATTYGAWSYPAYPPYPYYPFGYVAGSALAFTASVAVGAALWGNCNWGSNNVNINVNQYNSFNRTNISNSNWQHNVEHRKGVPYRDPGVAQQFGRGQASARTREAFRGRTEQDLANMRRDGAGVGDRSRDASRGPGGGDRAGIDRGRDGDRGGIDRGGGDRGRGGGDRPGAGNRAAGLSGGGGRGGRETAFGDIDRGSGIRASSDRGRASLGDGPRGGGGSFAGRGGGGGGPALSGRGGGGGGAARGGGGGGRGRR
ncbi:MAG: DUF3300 domain-containing protein [Xanthobacteraceae bacterium]|nr:DUF3300 domain-containing protein [Xanthobacteraceae bacterium]